MNRYVYLRSFVQRAIQQNTML